MAEPVTSPTAATRADPGTASGRESSAGPRAAAGPEPSAGDDPLVIAGTSFRSRLIVGTGGAPNLGELEEAMEMFEQLKRPGDASRALGAIAEVHRAAGDPHGLRSSGCRTMRADRPHSTSPSCSKK